MIGTPSIENDKFGDPALVRALNVRDVDSGMVIFAVALPEPVRARAELPDAVRSATTRTAPDRPVIFSASTEGTIFVDEAAIRRAADGNGTIAVSVSRRAAPSIRASAASAGAVGVLPDSDARKPVTAVASDRLAIGGGTIRTAGGATNGDGEATAAATGAATTATGAATRAGAAVAAATGGVTGTGRSTATGRSGSATTA